jgi:parvulin-like peptidyl-prolyl isomerase
MRSASIVAVFALAVALACSGGDDSWVAEVDDKRITRADLERAVAERGAPPDASHEDVLHEELERLVQERIVLNRAERLGVEIRDDEVDARIRELVGPDGEIPQGLATPEYREELRRQMLLDRTAVRELAERVEVSESALVHYFEEKREELRTPPRVRIRQIVVTDAEHANRILAELRKGADFAELAARESIAPEAGQGGQLPPFAEGEMPEEFDRVFRLQVGQLSPVVASPFGFHIFRVEEKIPAGEATFDDVREQLRGELEAARLAELRREWLRDLRASAQIRVNERLLERL